MVLKGTLVSSFISLLPENTKLCVGKYTADAVPGGQRLKMSYQNGQRCALVAKSSRRNSCTSQPEALVVYEYAASWRTASPSGVSTRSRLAE
ncbi:hypothetical protein BDD14_6580 [Edaphobacter modestus]|uniref:Uncharacterized protein n=1 Tax=Edaphobacter modestus TaxID=388466 RepID=A0A4Q7XZL1_9BACT|nr:hypothetical protein BDD14_6580 [Edaphobacter modestus]